MTASITHVGKDIVVEQIRQERGKIFL